MRDVLPIFVQLLFLTACTALVGEPLRILFSRFSSFFENLDILQMVTLDVYLGALTLYVIALVPLQFFSSITSVGVTITSFGLVIIYYAHNSTCLKGKIRSLRLNHLCILITVFLMFLTVLWLDITPRTSFILGSVHDEALHSLFAEVVIENQGIPETLEPYLSQPIVYTQAHTVVNVYACYILGYTPPWAVSYSTALFIALTVLGAYFLGSFLSGKVLGASFAFILAFVSLWPKRITWGANALIYGFAPLLICLGFLPSLLEPKGIKSRDMIAVGIVFGYLAASYLPFYEVLISSFIALLLVSILGRRRDFTSRLRTFLVIFISGVPVFVVSIYRFVKWYPSLKPPSKNISPFLWFEIFAHVNPFKDSWFSLYPIVSIEVLALIAVSAVAITLWRKNHFTAIKGSVKVILCNIMGITFFGALASLIPPAGKIINEEALMMAVILALLLLVGTFYALLCLSLTSGFRGTSRSFPTLPNPESVKCLQLRGNSKKILMLLFLLLTLAPFVFYRVVYDPHQIAQSVVYSVTTQDDYDLMLWMKNHMSKDATILINPFDAGNYIPSVSHLKACYPYHSAGRLNSSYQRLLSLLFDQNLNSTALELMKYLGVDHVFVGSKVSYWWEGYTRWDPLLFLNHPDFKLVHNIGRSYVFAVSH